jgi:hypothetical protein
MPISRVLRYNSAAPPIEPGACHKFCYDSLFRDTRIQSKEDVS